MAFTNYDERQRIQQTISWPPIIRLIFYFVEEHIWQTTFCQPASENLDELDNK